MVDINVGQIAEALNEKMDRNLANTDAIGQAILDKKVEVEALLEQNGYAKFTWKEGNKISNLIIQWGYISATEYFNFPRVFNNKPYIVSGTIVSGNANAFGGNPPTVMTANLTVAQCRVAIHQFANPTTMIFAIGT